MFEYSFVDLDDVLYNTYLRKDDIFEIFERAGVSAEDCEKSYKQAVFGPLVGYFDYTFKKHADILWEMGYSIPDKVLVELDGLFDKDYFDVQAKQFLVDMKKLSEKLILLTAGERVTQERKLKAIDTSLYFDKVVIIDGGKTQKILDIAGNKKNILFVNDNLQENIQIKKDLPYVLVVAKKHKVLWEGDDYSKYNMPCFDTLKEIQEYAAQVA